MAGPVAAIAATSPAANQYGGPPTVTGTATATATATANTTTAAVGGTAGVGASVKSLCARFGSRRLFTVSLPRARLRGERIVAITVYVNGKTFAFRGNRGGVRVTERGVVRTGGASNGLVIDFRGLPQRKTTNVLVTLRTNLGSTLSRRTILHPCVAGTASAKAGGRFAVTRRGRGSRIARASYGIGGGSNWIAFLMAGVAAAGLGIAGRRLVLRRRSQ